MKAPGYAIAADIAADTNAKTQTAKAWLLHARWPVQYSASDANSAMAGGPTPYQKPVAAASAAATRQISQTNLRCFIAR